MRRTVRNLPVFQLVVALLSFLAVPVAANAKTNVAFAKSEVDVHILASDTGDVHIGQLILVASELPAAAATAADPPCPTGSAQAPSGKPRLGAICDVPGGPPDIGILYESRYLGENDSVHRWSITARIEGLDRGASVERHVTVLIDGAMYWLSAKMKAPAATAQTLQISAEGKKWVVQPDDKRIGLQLLSKGAKQSSITLVSSSLLESDTNKRLSSSVFSLCNGQSCGPTLLVDGGKTTAVYLEADHDALSNGEFTGNLTFAADGVALSNAVELTVLSTSKRTQVLGVSLILLGVLVSWLVTVYMPHQAQRLEDLRPAIVLRDSAAAWIEKLDEADKITDVPSAQIAAILEQICADLQDAKLNQLGYVPGRIPPAGKASRKPAASYEIYLKQRSDRLTVIARVVARGIERIAGDWATYTADNKLAEAGAALGKLDKLSPNVAPNTVNAQVDAIVSALQGQVSSAQRSAVTRVSPVSITSEQLTTLVAANDTGMWALWIAITTVSGWAALILTNPGFGSPQDLFSCFGWGLGLQAIGPKLSTLNTATIAKQVKFNVPG